MKVDTNGKELSIGDKVHPLGRGGAIYYVNELGENLAGISPTKGDTQNMGVNYTRLVKLKDQS